jgi:asparagine synthase (glutamine-hydrolysing)
MCGLAGFLEFNDVSTPASSLNLVMASLLHRGSDSYKIKQGGIDKNFSKYKGVSLIHTRLSIIDLSNTSSQPMQYGDNLWIVFNGEIYNYLSLKENLIVKGYRFNTNSDTEVILAAYSEWGVLCLNHLNGMFSFSIWDEKKKEMFCARDPIGIKPFYYHINDNSFSFSSESNSLAKVINTKIDINSVASYLLSMYIPGNMSIYKDIKKLLPGHYMTITSNGETEIIKYFDVVSECRINSYKENTKENTKENVNNNLNRAVNMQLVGDVPIGLFLSGGFDSGIILANAASKFKSIDTYSVGFEYQSNSDELDIARSLSSRYGANHHEYIIDSKKSIEILNNALKNMSEPVADSAIVPMYFLSEMAAKNGTKVILSGTGGDEVFGGYPRYSDSTFSRMALNKTPYKLRKLIGKYLLKSGKLHSRIMNSSLDMVFNTGGSYNLVEKLFPSKQGVDEFINTLASNTYPKYDNSLDMKYNNMVFDLKSYVPDLLLFSLDQITMAHTIEGRVPLLDCELICSSYGAPSDMHIRKTATKKLLREICYGRIDDRTFKLKKQGFSGPVKHWVNEHKDIFIEKVQLLKNYDFLNELPLNEIIHNKTGRKHGEWENDMFILYCLSTWLEFHA